MWIHADPDFDPQQCWIHTPFGLRNLDPGPVAKKLTKGINKLPPIKMLCTEVRQVLELFHKYCSIICKIFYFQCDGKIRPDLAPAGLQNQIRLEVKWWIRILTKTDANHYTGKEC